MEIGPTSVGPFHHLTVSIEKGTKKTHEIINIKYIYKIDTPNK